MNSFVTDEKKIDKYDYNDSDGKPGILLYTKMLL